MDDMAAEPSHPCLLDTADLYPNSRGFLGKRNASLREEARRASFRESRGIGCAYMVRVSPQDATHRDTYEQFGCVRA